VNNDKVEMWDAELSKRSSQNPRHAQQCNIGLRL